MTQQSEQSTVWMTQDAHDKLTAELEEMKGPRRQEIVAKISAARDEGDLKENGGYHAAREEQGKLEGQISSSRRCCCAPRSARPRTTAPSPPA